MYKSLILSLITSNSITLCSKTKNAKNEIESIQNQALKIIGINKEDAKNKYNIDTTQAIIDKYCIKKMEKIIDDEIHPITSSLKKRNEEMVTQRRNFKYHQVKCKTTTYQQSFIPRYLKIMADNNGNDQPRG